MKKTTRRRLEEAELPLLACGPPRCDSAFYAASGSAVSLTSRESLRFLSGLKTGNFPVPSPLEPFSSLRHSSVASDLNCECKSFSSLICQGGMRSCTSLEATHVGPVCVHGNWEVNTQIHGLIQKYKQALLVSSAAVVTPQTSSGSRLPLSVTVCEDAMWWSPKQDGAPPSLCRTALCASCSRPLRCSVDAALFVRRGEELTSNRLLCFKNASAALFAQHELWNLPLLPGATTIRMIRLVKCWSKRGEEEISQIDGDASCLSW